jgi:hypothetical protein
LRTLFVHVIDDEGAVLGACTTASSYQASQIRRDDSEIGRERELLSDEALVLRRMVAEGDEAESEY